ncbi:MAG: outer membrane protein assembly factor BamD [Candidatus Cloacimonadota bacterium]|nr:outer membrane protein assembly factor BamD [Candidatus Cloacimonadota bacterium]
MKFNIQKLLVIIFAISIVACAHHQKVDNMTISRKMQKADRLYDNHKYNRAKDIYEIITFESRGDTLIRKAQFRLANSYFHLKLYEDAIYEYQELLRLYPLSSYAQNSLFMLGKSYYKISNPPSYDQTETIKAIEYFIQYLSNYPDAENGAEAENIIYTCRNKLLEKKYDNADLYFIMGYYNASLMYLKEILVLNRTSDIDEKSSILAAKIYIDQKDWDSLAILLERFRKNYPNHPYIKVIEQFIVE